MIHAYNERYYSEYSGAPSMNIYRVAIDCSSYFYTQKLGLLLNDEFGGCGV